MGEDEEHGGNDNNLLSVAVDSKFKRGNSLVDILMEGPDKLFEQTSDENEENETKQKEEESIVEVKEKKKKKKKSAKNNKKENNEKKKKGRDVKTKKKDSKSAKNENTKKKAKTKVSKTEKKPPKQSSKAAKKPKAATAKKAKGSNAGDLKEWMTKNEIYDKPLWAALVANQIDSFAAVKAMNQETFDKIVRKFRIERFAKVKGKKKQSLIDKQLVNLEKAWRKSKKGAKKKQKRKETKEMNTCFCTYYILM